METALCFGVTADQIQAQYPGVVLQTVASGIIRISAEPEVVAVIKQSWSGRVFGFDDEALAEQVLQAIRSQGGTLACAESCTGGLVAASLVSVPGASDVLMEGIVSYANASKQFRLGVPSHCLEQYGAVSEQTAMAMAQGVRTALHTTYGISTTGVAGPGGGTADKPVGTVYIGISGPKGTRAERLMIRADRTTVRQCTVTAVLYRLLQTVSTSTENGNA